MPVISQTFIVTFYPEGWNHAKKFQAFLGSPFPVKGELKKGTNTVNGHFQRLQHVLTIANRILVTLPEDARELDETGMSPALRCQEFALLVETMYCEMYSCLDGLRRCVYGIYRNVRKVQNGSTEKFFKLAPEYGPEFPESFRSKLTDSYGSWFPQLREIRTEVTHGEVGSCYFDRDKKTVTYFQPGINRNERDLIVEDVVSKLNELQENVNELVEHFFKFWYQQLEVRERVVHCGMWNAKMYARIVAPEPGLTFASGCCDSVNWFKDEPHYACPMRENCGAYSNREQKVREIAFQKWIERGRSYGEEAADWLEAETELRTEYLTRFGIGS
jgi:hypothetical protein